MILYKSIVFEPRKKLPVDHEKEQREFKHGFSRVKEVCERASTRARRIFSDAKSPIDGGSKVLNDFRIALKAHHKVRMAAFISTLVSNVEISCSRINNLPDTDCVNNWTKMWGQLWKLNVVPNPAPSTFSGPDGDLLREMYRLFKSDYSILVEKLKPHGLVSPEFGVRVEMEHLKADDELLKKALFPKDPKKPPKLNSAEYQQMQSRLNAIEEESETKSEKFSDVLDMHAKLLKDAKSTRDASKVLFYFATGVVRIVTNLYTYYIVQPILQDFLWKTCNEIIFSVCGPGLESPFKSPWFESL